MEKERMVLPPPSGYMKELAQLCGCKRTTVWRALKQNGRGEKCDMVRKMYKTKYVDGK
ncbi:MAG: hypothetical protein LBC40_00890 [Dysgonamonadaceae bacterium]|jgi:hypothetical protein|nr:hypothetical protein [Dysgonamonadaceae bacterium]